MGGGLMQLVAYGAQDIYLTGNPQITFFKVVYRRHTNFAMEAVEQTMNGSSAYGGKAVATVSRNGDLVGRMYVEHNVTVPVSAASSTVDTANNYGHALLREVTCEIGGQEIDKQTGRWMQIWSDLTEFNPTAAVAESNVTNAAKHFGEDGGTLFQRMTGTGKGDSTGIAVAATTRMFVPLQFWFNRNPGLALPLIALQYHEVKVTVQFEEQAKLIRESGANALTDLEFKLWADYIYLDTDERRRFAQVSHEYLIEQVQTQDFSMTTAKKSSHNLTFNHPVKELVWQVSDATNNGDLSGGDGSASTLASGIQMTAGKVGLKLNGHDRFAERDIKYFTRAQVWQHHTGNPGTVASDSVAVYSFALKPEEHQPSGTCNFSRIDNAQLVANITGTNADNLHVYAVNYNVLRVMSGMGGLAYSN
jgi:hypothetical protein